MRRIQIPRRAYTKGLVEFAELPAECFDELRSAMSDVYSGLDVVGELVRRHAKRRFDKGNLIFNFPREQYSALDRGETPEAIDAKWLTLSAAAYTDPAIETVTGESLRLQTTARAADPSNPKNSILRFLIGPGQFIGAFNTAILIGGSGATSTTGTGKIVAAVNNVKDDTGASINRDGSTVHLVTWKIKHLDSSEV